MRLITDPHLSAPDDFYEALIDAHRDLSQVDSHALNARLVLLLANHIGTLEVLRGCTLNDLRRQSSCEDTRLGQPDPRQRGPV